MADAPICPGRQDDVCGAAACGGQAEGRRKMNRLVKRSVEMLALLAVVGLALWPALAAAAPARQTMELVLQNGLNGYAGCVDTYMDRWGATTPHDASNLSVQYTSANHDTRSALVKFDLTPLPAGVNILSASLSLYATYTDAATPLTIGAYRLLREWVASQATWNEAAAGAPWGLAGARDTTSDRDAAATTTAIASSVNGWLSFDITERVREWASAPAQNAGMILLAQSSGTGGNALFSFIDSHLGMATLRPKLTILYDAGPAFTATTTPTRTATPSPTATRTSSPTASASPVATGGTLVLQNGLNGYAGCTDTYMNRWSSSTNYGGGNSVVVEYSSSSDISSALLSFDLASLPAGATISSARLTVTATTAQNDPALTIRLYRLRRAWVGSQATWNAAASGQPWAAGGANDTTADRYATATASAVTVGINTPVEFDITSLATLWANTPAQNFGMILRAEGTAGPLNKALYSFVSSEAAGGSVTPLRPKLTIVYTLAAVSPTATRTATQTLAPTATQTVGEPGPTGTATATPTSSHTPTGTATRTPTRTPTFTRTPTSGPALATLVLQQGLDSYGGTRDTYLDGYAPNTNRGNDPEMMMRYEMGLNKQTLLVKFGLNPLNNLPAGSVIQQAVLGLWVTSQSNGNYLWINSYRVVRSWGETEATWLNASAGNAWAEPGALNVGGDHVAETSARGELDSAGNWFYQDWTYLIPIWRADPGLNYGAVFTSTNWGATVTYHFATSENATPEIRPRLVITYTLPMATPTATPAKRMWLPLIVKERAGVL